MTERQRERERGGLLPVTNFIRLKAFSFCRSEQGQREEGCVGKERKKEEEINATDHLFRTLTSYVHVNEALPKRHQAFKTTVVWVFRGMGKRWNPLHNDKNPHTA